MLALRAVSAATEFVFVAAFVRALLATDTVPATALVSWVPLTVPPVELT